MLKHRHKWQHFSGKILHENLSHLQIQHLFSRIVNEIAGQGAGRGAVGKDDGIFSILAPLGEKLPREARLKVRLAAKHHLWVGYPGQVCQTVAKVQVSELERIVPFVLKTPHEFVTHPLHLQRGVWFSHKTNKQTNKIQRKCEKTRKNKSYNRDDGKTLKHSSKQQDSNLSFKTH